MSASRGAFLLLALLLAGGCAREPERADEPVEQTAANVSTPASPLATHFTMNTPNAPWQAPHPRGVRWNVYDPDPQHLWNRMFRRFLGRVSADGTEYGWDSLDPLLWYETTYLLEETSHSQAVHLLDEFLSSRGELLITDPVRRALLQRDLWAVFDWSALRSDTFPEERQALQRRLAKVIRRLGLPRQEILSLPDNLKVAVDSMGFPADFQTDDPEHPFLPADLLATDSGWLLLGRDGGPLAMSHTESFPFFGRSVFLVYLKTPGGREATEALLNRLNGERDSRSLAAVDLTGVEVALVRRAVLIDDRGEMVLSPLVESVQVRYYGPVQLFYEFDLDRAALLDDGSGGLRPAEEEFMRFFSHGWDVFEPGTESPMVAVLHTCRACHGSPAYGLQSILSYSRFRFDLQGGEEPVLLPTTIEREAESVIEWKLGDSTWLMLDSYMAP